MKKYLIGLFVIFAFAFGMCSCVITIRDNDENDDTFKRVQLYRGYFYNESDWTITSWGVRDVNNNKVYQCESSSENYISPNHYNGPLYVPENSEIAMQMMFKRDHDVYETPSTWKVRGNFNFHFYYDDDYDWERRQAGETAAEAKPYLKDDEGNVIFLEKVTEGAVIKAFDVE